MAKSDFEKPEYPTGTDRHSCIDLDRARRQGFPEVVFGAGKQPEQLEDICATLLEVGQPVLITRADDMQAEFLRRSYSQLEYCTLSRTITINPAKQRVTSNHSHHHIAVLCAGTSDLPVAEEAARCIEFWGFHVKRYADIGVAGLHRLTCRIDAIRQASVIIAVAGMEGALPSVVAGLVDKPVIAVPTSVGYGASFGGVAALLAMLNSCASGVSVVNIDNGFGAAFQAATICRLLESASAKCSESVQHREAIS